MEISQLILTTIILLIPTFLAFVASIYYVKKKNNIVGKFLLLGSFLVLLTWIMLFYVNPYILENYPKYNNITDTLSMTSGAVGYFTFFISFFYLIRNSLKKEKLKFEKNELNNIGK